MDKNKKKLWIDFIWLNISSLLFALLTMFIWTTLFILIFKLTIIEGVIVYVAGMIINYETKTFRKAFANKNVTITGIQPPTKSPWQHTNHEGKPIIKPHVCGNCGNRYNVENRPMQTRKINGCKLDRKAVSVMDECRHTPSRWEEIKGGE